jgi:hypothetical protein
MCSLMLFQFTPGAFVLSAKIIRVGLQFLEFESRSRHRVEGSVQPHQSGPIFFSDPVGFSGETRTLWTDHHPGFHFGVHNIVDQ